jgi:hypothetical protein
MDALYQLSYVGICIFSANLISSGTVDPAIGRDDLILTMDALYQLSYVGLAKS